MLRRTVAIAAAAALAGAIPALGNPAGASGTPSSTAPAKTAKAGLPAGPFALSGAEAAAVRLPRDVVRLGRTRLPDGSTSTRYQQVVGGASVLNGQITVVRRSDGTRAAIVGAHYPALNATSSARLSPGQAVGTAARKHGACRLRDHRAANRPAQRATVLHRRPDPAREALGHLGRRRYREGAQVVQRRHRSRGRGRWCQG